jgi:isocitrate dehydrogenase kinase/phosphatase
MSLARSPASSENAALTDSRLAALCSGTVHRAFLDYDEHFHAITLRARERFLNRDWGKSYADAAERLHLYGREMEVLTKQIKEIMGLRLRERAIWTAMKAGLLLAHRAIRKAGNCGEFLQLLNATCLCD